MRFCKPIIFYLLFFIPFNSNGQQTIIKGRVTDAFSNDPLPFVNIFFKESSKGTTTNFEGRYELKSTEPFDSLVASCLGYNKRVKPVKNNSEQIINFQLYASDVQLGEVVIKPGINPAFPILDRVIENKPMNDKMTLTSYQYSSYNRVQVAIDKMPDRFKNKKIFKPVAEMFDTLKEIAGEDGKTVLPMIMAETYSEFYFRKDPDLTKEIIIASKVAGVGLDENSWINQVMGGSFQVFNFYDTWIHILLKNFISPIAKGGKSYYIYELKDSVYIDGERCYEIVVTPKRHLDLAFWGTIWIEDSTYALKQVDMEIKKEANLNWVERLKIQQKFERTVANAWLPVKTRILVDFIELKNQAGLIAKSYTSINNIVVNKPQDPPFYQQSFEVEEKAYSHDEDFWEEKRDGVMTTTEKSIYAMIDSVKNIPAVRTLVDFVDIAVNGYYRVGKVDLGPYITLYNNNSVEGSRFRFGLKTNELFSRKWILKGYLAYGVEDMRWKYNAQAEYILSRKRWTIIGVQRRDDIDQVSVTDDSFTAASDLFAASTLFARLYRLNNSNEYRVWAEGMIFKSFIQKLMFHHRIFTPYFPFGYYPNPGDFSKIKTEFTTSELVLESRYAPLERYIYINNSRVIVDANVQKPVISLRYSLGIKDFFNSSFNYHKLYVNIDQTLKVGNWGKSRYILTAGKIFNPLPYPLLEVHRGNESIVGNPGYFYLMNFFEFVSDEFVTLLYEHHFEGLFMNRIPLLKKLKLRSLVTANMAYGNLSKTNNLSIDENGYENYGFSTLTKKPYIETGIGIENILNFIRIDGVFRLTYNDAEYRAIYPRTVRDLGIKIFLQFRF